MAESQIIFQVRIRLPDEKSGDSAVITSEQMTATIDKAYARGECKGWNAAMAAVREAVSGGGFSIPEGVFRQAAKHAPRFV